MTRRIGLLPRKVVTAGLRGYQRAISPWLPSACRFAPTCSEYARQAVERYGVMRGGWLAVCRLGRCHPFHRGGWDPVPELDLQSKLVLRTHKSL